jgi:endo-1,4-beta-xylanase
MQFKTKFILLFSAIAGMVSACKKSDKVDNPGSGTPIDTTGPLKAAASFPIGMAIDYTIFKSNVNYRITSAREVDSGDF